MRVDQSGRMSPVRVATFLGAAALAGSVLAQDAAPPRDTGPPPPSFPSRIEQVIVDVVVTNARGQPVSGLTRDDLIVKEDGVRQTVQSFEAVELPAQPVAKAPLPSPISTNVGPEGKHGRTFVIVFDDMNLMPFRTRDAKAAVASFLDKGVREGDSVTLISTSGGTWWTSRMVEGRSQLLELVGRLEGRRIPDTSPERMSDWEAMRIHVYSDPLVSQRVYQRYTAYGVALDRANPGQTSLLDGSVVDPFVNEQANSVYTQARTRNRLTLTTIERALRGLVGGRGRKSLILVSEGFINDPNLEEFRKVEEAARRANTAVYFLNARGLEGLPEYYTAQFGPALPAGDMSSMFQETHESAGGSERIADESGGFTVHNTNDLGAGIERIADETRVYYLLGYTPTNTARDGTFREIEVGLRAGKGLKVRARRGYYAPTGEAPADSASATRVDPLYQAALDSPWSEDAIPIRMTHYVGEERLLGKASVVVAAEVDTRALTFEKKDDRFVDAIQFVLVVAHRQTGEYSRYDQTIDLDLREATRERLQWFWFPITRDFELPPGDHQAKIVVRDVSTGKLGSVVHEFEVPPLDEFRVSTPILTDTRRRAESGGIEPQVLARRDFVQGSPLMCQFDVYGAAKDAGGMPRVAQGYEIRRSDGSVYARMAESVINPTSLGALSRLVTFSLKDATPGDYEMRLTFRDELSGKTLEVKEPFRVVLPPGARSAAAAPPGR
jgi:VWFA-related protein